MRTAAAVPFVLATALAWAAMATAALPAEHACADARRLWKAGLLDESQRAYTAIRRAAPTTHCAGPLVDPPDVTLAGVQSARAGLLESARTLRRAVALRRPGVPRFILQEWWRDAYDSYLGGLALDPSSAGARRGLRALLVTSPAPGGNTIAAHCARARELLRQRLLQEARVEYVRALGPGRPGVCGDLGATMRARRGEAYSTFARGRSSERAGDLAGARRLYIAALDIDPGLASAVAGLRRTPPPAITKRIPKESHAPGFLSTVPNAVPKVIFWALVLVGVALLVRVGWRRWLRGKVPFTTRPDDTLTLRLDGPVDPIQRQALQLAATKLRQLPVGAEGTVRRLILKSDIPTDFAPGGLPGGQTEIETAFQPVGRFRALVKMADRYDGQRRSSAMLTAVPGEGFVLGKVVSSDGTLVRDGKINLNAGDDRTADALAQTLISAALQGNAGA